MALASPSPPHPGLPRPSPISLSPSRARSLFTPSLPHACASRFFSTSVRMRQSGGASLHVLRAKRTTDRDEDLSAITEAGEEVSSKSHNKINAVEVPLIEAELDKENDSEKSKASSLRSVTLWVLAAVTFGVGIAMRDGLGKASEFFAGYLLEESLSVDNLFVFVLVFRYLKVPKQYQKRVLSYGIVGAVIFRAIMILLGAATLQRFEVVNLLLALILLFTSYKLFSAEEEETDLSDNFIVKTCQRFIPVTTYYDGDRFLTNQDGVWKATPLLLTVAVIELSDIAFAIDSIPAVFGVTRDPLIILSSNIFAISGLRSLFVLISEGMSDLEYLQPAIGIVLGFIGSKMILDFFGFHVPTEVSLAIVAACLSGGVILSLKKKSDEIV
ncbi:Integral membrane protein TerC family [Carex littledalei]|uniref:Integral membrane protein TerC family n=1 Tax=Carex littledalei TaxID=544730 RepID=A0A833R8Z6_9POAL|nr:Integral membrane protein TerC family [Carex littledalei]